MNIRLSLVVWLFAAAVFAQPAWSVEVGELAPDFTAQTYEGKEIRSAELKGKIVVLEWFNPNCPFVKKQYRAGDMQRRQKEAAAKSVVWLTVNSTHPEHRDYLAPSAAAELFQKMNLSSAAFIHDGQGQLGKLFGAKATPQMAVIDAQGKLAYRGAIDDDESVRGDPGQARNYVAQALDELLAGKSVSTPETKPYGCSVKY